MKKKTFDNFLFDIFKSKKKTEVVQQKDNIPPQVRKVLNKIDYVFQSNDVHYEIPFVYKQNNDFKSLKIIVSNLYTPQQICDLFEIDEYRINKEFVDVVFDNIKITFILTPDDDITIAFWYYSWDIMTTLMNVLFEEFGLRFDKDGLKYIYKNNYLLSKKIDEIVEFLGLNFNQYKSGFFTLENEIDYVMNSPSFNADIFYKYKLNPKDHFLKENTEMFIKSLEIYEPFKNTLGNFKFSEDKGVYLSFIAEYFIDSGLLEKIVGQKK